MFAREIEYKDLDGKATKGKFWFSLNEGEVAQLELRHNGGLTGLIERLIATTDNEKALEEFKRIILMCYGVRDGDSFIKTPEMRIHFEGHPAFSALYIEFFTKDGALAEFIAGALPQDFNKDKTDEPKAPVMPPPPLPTATVAAGTEIANAAGY